MPEPKTLYIVVPCYNEEEVLPESAKQLTDKLRSLIHLSIISEDSRVAFVNDGSKDHTWSIIEELHRGDQHVVGVNLSRNRGHQNAVLAGLLTVKEYADMAISIDADLQDDIETIDEMVKEYYNGNDVVYGVRNKRDTDTAFKRMTAEGFYKFMSRMGVDIVFNHADYRLMSRRVLDALEDYREVNLFLRGIVPLIGFPSTNVYYARKERFAGESKYPFKKMLAFSLDGITSFSIKPIRFISTIGLAIFMLSLVMLVYSIIRHLAGQTTAGWSSLIVSIWAIGGLQLLSIGIVGEYIGKIYLEAKARPRYAVKDFLKR